MAEVSAALSHGASCEPIAALGAVLHAADLKSLTEEALSWCEEQGASRLSEVDDDEMFTLLADALRLKPLERRRLRETLQRALKDSSALAAPSRATPPSTTASLSSATSTDARTPLQQEVVDSHVIGGRVLEKAGIRTASSGIRYFDAIVKDQHTGKSHRLVFWREAADSSHALFVPGGEYLFEGGRLKPPKDKWVRPGIDPCEIHFDETPSVTSLPQTATALPASVTSSVKVRAPSPPQAAASPVAVTTAVSSTQQLVQLTSMRPAIGPTTTQYPLSATHARTMEDLSLDVELWQLQGPSMATYKGSAKHYSRASRLLQWWNETQEHSQRAVLGRVNFALAVDGGKTEAQVRAEALRDMKSGQPLFQANGKSYYPAAPREREKSEPPQLWLVGVPISNPDPGAVVSFLRESQGCFFGESNGIKRASRLELLFSQTVPTAENWMLQVIPDIERNGYMFTDGCGSVSTELLEDMKARFLELVPWRSERLQRAVQEATGAQIRVLGYKGVVVLDPGLTGRQLVLPLSMRKFTVPGVDENHNPGADAIKVTGYPIEVVEFPFVTKARVPRQVLMVAGAVCGKKVLDEVLASQRRQLDNAMKLATEPNHVKALEQWQAMLDKEDEEAEGEVSTDSSADIMDTREACFQKLLAGFNPATDTHLRRQLLEEVEDHIRSLSSRVPIADAWYAMQVPDWSGTLPEGVVYVPWLAGSCKKYVVLAKSPLYEPGNLRKLRVAGPNEFPALSHLRGCVVLSTQGDRPEQDMCFGADCDGDKPLVVANEAFLPEGPSEEPQDYRLGKVKVDHPDDLAQNMAAYLEANWDAFMGKVDHALMRLGTEGLAMMRRSEYKCLAKMFSEEVDAAKHGRHIDSRVVHQKLDRALGFRQDECEETDMAPNFQAFDEHFRPKFKFGRNHGPPKVLRPMNFHQSAVCRVFEAAKAHFDRVAPCRLQLFVSELDPDLKAAWGTVQDQDRLLGIAQLFVKDFNHRQAEHLRNHPLPPSDSKPLHRSLARSEVLQRVDRSVSPFTAFLMEERKRLLKLADEAVGGNIRNLALALYIQRCKYLIKEELLDTTNYPWNLVAKELIEAKRNCCPQAMVAKHLLHKLHR